MSLVKPYTDTNYISNPMGIPAHDFVKLVYDETSALSAVEYYIGESQDTGTKVARQELSYDASGNLISVERVE
jgi:hypothetical protein